MTHEPKRVGHEGGPDGCSVEEQAADLERLLPHLMRSLFTLDRAHPLVEMPLAQLRLCSVLQCGPRPLSDIARTLGISASAVSQLADRLENAGMVERAPGAEVDRRVKCLRLTPVGEALMRERRALRREHVAAALCRLPTDERAGVLASLRALFQASACISEAPELDRELEPITVRLEITGD